MGTTCASSSYQRTDSHSGDLFAGDSCSPSAKLLNDNLLHICENESRKAGVGLRVCIPFRMVLRNNTHLSLNEEPAPPKRTKKALGVRCLVGFPGDQSETGARQHGHGLLWKSWSKKLTGSRTIPATASKAQPKAHVFWLNALQAGPLVTLLLSFVRTPRNF